MAGFSQLYSVRGDVKLPDDTTGWLWRADPGNTDAGGLPVPTAASGAAPASDAERGPTWLTPWEARMILAGAARGTPPPEFSCPFALDQVLMLGLELLRLLSTAMVTLSGADGGKAAPSGGPAPTLVAWLKDRAMDVGQGLVRLCQHSRGDTLLAPALERELKQLLSRVGVSTSRVQFSEEYDFDVPSLVAREQTYTEAVAAADKERFEKLTAVVAESGSDSYGREAVVDVGYDVLGDIGDDDGAVADEGTADRMQVPP